MQSEAPLASDSRQQPDNVPKPPSLHWALVLLFSLLTGGILFLVWMFRQAAWVRRIDPMSKALRVLVIAFLTPILAVVAAVALGAEGPLPTVIVLAGRLIFAVAWVWSYFSMRNSIEARFGLNLSGLLTFFFTVFYLQYHLRRIAKGTHTPHRDGLFG